MTSTPRDRFLAEREHCGDQSVVADSTVRDALLDFADALDPEVPHVELPSVSNGTVDGHGSKSNGTAKQYLSAVRHVATRGLPILTADADTVNAFFDDYVTEPDKRRHDLVDHNKKVKRSTASTNQAALRQFYRFHTEPGFDRADVGVDWPADETASDGGIRIFSTEQNTVDHDGYPQAEDLDAMRAACIESTNTRRDRAIVEMVAGTGQRITAILTLRVRDVADHIECDCNCPDSRRSHPHILLNPAIDGDGDKGAIENAGRWRPLLSDPEPIRKWLDTHPLRDNERRSTMNAQDSFNDCFVFIGDAKHNNTDVSTPLGRSSVAGTLERRKADTAHIDDVKTVDRPVNPHAWRHYCYTRSEQLPISEKERRALFGWTRGSNTGEKLYGHEKASQAAARFADAWQDAFDDDQTDVAGQIVGDALSGTISPEARRAVVQDILDDEEALADIAAALDGVAD